MAAVRFLTTAKQTLRRHPDIIPLLGACVYSGSLGLTVLGYTSLRKSDVQWNRWGNPDPRTRVDWTKPTQVWLATNPNDYAGYKPQFSEEQKLESLIYEDGDYSP